MGNGDLSTDLALGILPSAPAEHAEEEEGAANLDTRAKVRRRLAPKPEDETLDDSAPSSASSELTPHQLDRLA